MKKKRTLAALLAVILAASQMTACGDKSSSSDESPAAAASAESETSSEGETSAPEEDSKPDEKPAKDNSSKYIGIGEVGNKWICSIIAGAVSADTKVELKDDFYTAANLDMLASYEIKPGQYSAGTAVESSEILKERLYSILDDESLDDHNAELVHKVYSLVLDWDKRNSLGVEPFKATIKSIQDTQTLDELLDLLRDSDDPFLTSFVGMSVDAGIGNKDMNTVYISPGTTFYSDAADYAEPSQQALAMKLFYTSFVEMALGKFGYTKDEAKDAIDQAFEFETLFTKSVPSFEEMNEPGFRQAHDNVYTYDELKELEGNVPIVEWLDAEDMPKSDSYTVMIPEWLSDLGDALTEENLPIIKSYLLTHYAISVVQLADRESLEQAYDIQNKFLGGEGIPEDKEIALGMVSSMTGFALDYLYIDQFCSEEKRQEIIDIVNEFKDYYHEMLAEEDWLSEETREKAIEKLDAIKINACFSDDRIDYSDFDLSSAEDIYSLSVLVNDYTIEEMKKKINQPAETDMFKKTSTLDTNAYYNPADNSITILCGILEGGFEPGKGIEHDLGSIGFVIGHELTHAFDPNGAEYDKDGNYINWWTDEDFDAFDARSQKVIDYLGKITPYKGMEPVNGALVNDELIADMGSVKASMYIASKHEGFDYDKYFRTCAATWSQIYAEQMLQYIVSSDNHPIGNLRVNIPLQQTDEFMETYDIKEGDGMYLAPEDRIAIW